MMENAVEHHRKRHHSDGDDADGRRVRPALVETGRMSGSLQPAPGNDPRPADGADQDRQRAVHLPSPPDSECSSSEDDDIDDDDVAAGPDRAELAGFEYCAREAIRYLVEEERLDDGHPMVRQLRQHLFDGQRVLLPPADAGAVDRPAAASARRPSDDLAPRQ